MYEKTEIALIIGCSFIIVFGLIGYIKSTKYKKDVDGQKKIINFFKENGKDGIRPQDMPKEIIQTGYIAWMQKDKTIIFKDGRYFLNKEK